LLIRCWTVNDTNKKVKKGRREGRKEGGKEGREGGNEKKDTEITQL